ncbi:PglL family O-oligosaccharyltransferase [Motiliproteus sp. SC1-56]|uniref:PglL family O-oligosaccharyltransferase n=1 Tax=Motiliproteus sp. SC1-56 TaxID=2799565 RepID=UPI001A8CE2D6|nr:Wzy polymerase domain-containing protein [Motiliproteus sp. SC1-56]
MSLAESPHLLRFNRAFVALCGGLFLLAPLYYQDNLGGEGLYIPFNNVVWVFTSFIIGLGLIRLLTSNQVRVPPLTLPLLFFVAVTTLLGVINEVSTPVSWLFRNLAIWGGVLLFFAAAQFPLNRRWGERLLYVLVASSLLQALICLAQLTITSPPLGWLPQSPGVPRGIFQQQNLAATFLATGLAACFYLVTAPGFRRSAAAAKALLLSAATLNTMILLTAGSRVGLLAATISLLLIGACRLRPLLNRPRYGVFFLVAVLIGAGIGTQLESRTGGFSSTLDKLEAVSSGTDDPQRGDVRLMIYGSSWDLFKQAPIMGHGIGGFQKAWHDYKPLYHDKHPDAAFLKDRLTHPHNEILFWGLEGGLLALLGLLVVAVAFLRQIFRLGWQRGGAYLALVIPITLHTQVELPFYISQLHWLTLMLLVALAASHHVRTRPVRLSRMARPLVLATGVAIPTLVTVFMSHSLVANRYLTDVTFTQAPQAEQAKKLRFAEQNLFYQDRAEFIAMQGLLRYALAKPEPALLPRYIDWAEAFLEVIPEASIMSALAVALYENGQEQEGAEMITHAIALYPTQAPVRQAEDYLNKQGLEFNVPRPGYLKP